MPTSREIKAGSRQKLGTDPWARYEPDKSNPSVPQGLGNEGRSSDVQGLSQEKKRREAERKGRLNRAGGSGPVFVLMGFFRWVPRGDAQGVRSDVLRDAIAQEVLGDMTNCARNAGGVFSSTGP